MTEIIRSAENRAFTIQDISAATGLSPSQVFGVLRHMLSAGMLQVAGERHEPGRPGRGTRLYAVAAASEVQHPHLAPSGASAAVLGRVRAIVAAFADRFDFTATDVEREARVGREAVRWTLLVLAREGVLRALVEIRPNEISGRPAQRWTSNPENMATQDFLARRIQEIEGG